MDTKWKNFRFWYGYKIIALLAGMLGAVMVMVGLCYAPHYRYVLDQANGQSSMYYRLDNLAGSVVRYYLVLRNPEYIQSGSAIDPDSLRRRQDNIENDRQKALRAAYDEYDLSAAGDEDYKQYLRTQRDKQVEAIHQEYDQTVKDLRKTMIEEQLADFRNTKARLDEWGKGVLFTIIPQNSELGTITNDPNMTPESYRKRPVFQEMSSEAGGEPYTLYMTYTEAQYVRENNEEVHHKNLGMRGIYQAAGGLLICFFSICWLMFLAGRRRQSEELQVSVYARLYLDVGAALLVGVYSIIGVLVVYWIQLIGFEGVVGPVQVAMGGLAIGVYFLAALYCMSLSVHFKQRTLLQHTLTYVVLRWIFRRMRCWAGRVVTAVQLSRAHLRTTLPLLLFSVGHGLVALIALVVGFATYSMGAAVIAAIIAYVWLLSGAIISMLRRERDISQLHEGVSRMKDGALGDKIEGVNDALIGAIATDINNISEGLKCAVDSEVKAEQVKMELITNVSHDLKTPLTSIITYSDLLAHCTLPDDAREYTAVIANKADRLRLLMDDLFVVSKAHTGDLDVVLEPLSLHHFLEQFLAEYEERFEEYKLIPMYTPGTESLTIMADSGRLLRVFSNLLGNALKYSLTGTRVYVDVGQEDGTAGAAAAVITVRNIANYPLKFDPTAITGRFVRADEARTTDGSGLGLSIAQSFVELMGGRLDITVDGDLFKVRVAIPLAG